MGSEPNRGGRSGKGKAILRSHDRGDCGFQRAWYLVLPIPEGERKPNQRFQGLHLQADSWRYGTHLGLQIEGYQQVEAGESVKWFLKNIRESMPESRFDEGERVDSIEETFRRLGISELLRFM